jgi:hypothetical protein
LHANGQAALPVGTYAAGVVITHFTFAALEKKRLENWQEKGEVSPAKLSNSMHQVLIAGYP